MINVFFVPGMFGTTIEFCLKNFTNEHQPTSIALENFILNDGSMHGYKKTLHAHDTELYRTVSLSDYKSIDVATLVYPNLDKHLPELLEILYQSEWFLKNKNILVYADTYQDAELNMFFQYYKIAVGLKQNLDIFFGDAPHFKKWNTNYSSWKEMQRWEQREYFSIFYPSWIREWIDSKDQVDSTFLKITSNELLCKPNLTLNKIIDFCGLSRNNNDLDNFLKIWQNKQDYIVTQYELCNTIVKNVINQNYYTLPELGIIHEAVIQKKLRDFGYELQCYNLNKFPSDTLALYKMLKKV